MEEEKEKVEAVSAEAEQKKELTDDELYAQIQTEKLLKKKKVRKAVTISSLCLAFVLAVCLIVLAAVPVSLKPKCAVDGFVDVELFHGTQSMSPDIEANFGVEENTDKFNLFMEKYNQSFKTSYLTAIFNGSLSYYKIEEGQPDTKPNNELTDEEYENSCVPSAFTNRDCYFAKLDFGKDRKFVKQNGQVYLSRYSPSSSALWDGSLKYRYVFVEINKAKSGTVTFYVLGKSPLKKSNSDDVVVNYHWVTVEVKADTNPIYNAWSELTKVEN